jgi:hypothetical protein
MLVGMTARRVHKKYSRGSCKKQQFFSLRRPKGFALWKPFMGSACYAAGCLWGQGLFDFCKRRSTVFFADKNNNRWLLR